MGVDEEGDEESLVSSSSSSEDEGVELDGEEDEEAEREGGRLLHQLAATLANELKQCRERQRAATTTDPVVAADHTCLRSKGGASDCRDAASPFNGRGGGMGMGSARRRRPANGSGDGHRAVPTPVRGSGRRGASRGRGRYSRRLGTPAGMRARRRPSDIWWRTRDCRLIIPRCWQ